MRTRKTIAVLCLVLAAACGGGDDGNEGAGTNSDPGANAASSTGEAGAAQTGCLLSVDEVSSVLGLPVEVDGTCSFYPVGDAFAPNASYNRQSPITLDASILAEEGITQAVPGVGDKAYTYRDARGTWLRVGAGNRIFEVRVAAGNAETELQAAKRLAAFVIAE